jgi:hypothetical protein
MERTASRPPAGGFHNPHVFHLQPRRGGDAGSSAFHRRRYRGARTRKLRLHPARV